ncbi:3-dehydroquinate synthase [Streptomyces griseorubiginosus]|uniref:3-dehydroquinate synthase n=1 Tax=Streptomyces griseorubiginosus TaxID=67304 RepID=UPI0011403138|nr:3-dehydroquinate synthase family protein [Streptomyces griseorubiginosus]
MNRLTHHRVEVELGDRAYTVHIGAGVRGLLPELVAATGASRAVVVSARPEGELPPLGVPTLWLAAHDGEDNKNLAAVARLCEHFARFGLTRSDVVISCGGGTTTDTVGLAAALYHRGTPVIHLPTSLLAQVDASIGGKTGVNLPEGKNLVGTYWQPRAVLCDTGFLATLPARERVNGHGELARCHFIGAEGLAALPLEEQIARSVALKASVVSRDERDQGLRHILNYGHTLGHALERATDYALRHGEAVGVGTVFAGRLAGALGRVPPDRVREHHEVVASYGLPTALPADVDHDALIAYMLRDKKAEGHGLTFVLDGPDGPELVADVPERTVREQLALLDTDRGSPLPDPRESALTARHPTPHP